MPATTSHGPQLLSTSTHVKRRWRSPVMKRRLAGWFAGLALLLFLPHTASAQSFNATLTGSVTDPSGASVPGVEVTLTSKATGSVAKSKTGSDGLFSFPNLQSGEYELKTSAS